MFDPHCSQLKHGVGVAWEMAAQNLRSLLMRPATWATANFD